MQRGFFISASLLLSAALLTACGGNTSGVTPTGNGAMGRTVAPMSSAASSLKCFAQDAGSGGCTISKDGVVTLNLDNPPNADAGVGVYFSSSNSLKGTTIANLTALSFTVSGPYQAGSPRVSIPVTYNGGSATVFIYPEDCSFSNPELSNQVVNPLASPDAAGNYCMGITGDGGSYSTWSSFVATYGSAVIASPPLFLADADNATGGTWTLKNIKVK